MLLFVIYWERREGFPFCSEWPETESSCLQLFSCSRSFWISRGISRSASRKRCKACGFCVRCWYWSWAICSCGWIGDRSMLRPKLWLLWRSGVWLNAKLLISTFCTPNCWFACDRILEDLLACLFRSVSAGWLDGPGPKLESLNFALDCTSSSWR